MGPTHRQESGSVLTLPWVPVPGGVLSTDAVLTRSRIQLDPKRDAFWLHDGAGSGGVSLLRTPVPWNSLQQTPESNT